MWLKHEPVGARLGTASWQHCQDSWDQLDDVPAAVRVSESCSTYAPGHPMKTERDVGLY